MNEFIKSLEHFITRDALYIIGGVTILSSVAYVMGTNPLSEFPTHVVLLAAGISYVLGYVAQDAMSILGYVSTSYVRKPSRLTRFFYRRLVGMEWSDVEVANLYESDVLIHERASERDFAAIQRYITLKQLGSTMGASFLISGLILLVNARATADASAVGAGFAMLATSLVLSLISRVKAAQQLALVGEISKRSI